MLLVKTANKRVTITVAVLRDKVQNIEAAFPKSATFFFFFNKNSFSFGKDK